MQPDYLAHLHHDELRVLLAMFREGPDVNLAHYRILKPVEFNALVVSHYVYSVETSKGIVARLTIRGTQAAAFAAAKQEDKT